MAILFNPQALSRFANVNFGKDKSIVNLGADKETLVKNNELGCFLWKPFRSEENEAKNNAVRTELLKALGQAFEINGVTEHGGQTLFSSAFMDRLEEILGPAFKRGDFGIKDGVVDSGKPLTQRRIQAIVKAARAKGDAAAYDGTTYLAKVDYIKGWIKDKKGLDAAQPRSSPIPSPPKGTITTREIAAFCHFPLFEKSPPACAFPSNVIKYACFSIGVLCP